MGRRRRRGGARCRQRRGGALEATGRMRDTGAGWGSGAASGTHGILAGGGAAGGAHAHGAVGGGAGSPTVLGLGRVSKVARVTSEVTLVCCSPAHAIPVCRGMKLPSLNFEETSTWHSGVHVVCPLAHTIPVCRGMKLPSVNSEETSTR